jgi:hypothetical protein
MQVSWDWASETQDVTVMDNVGQVVDRWSLTHDEAGLDRAIGRLARDGRPHELPVAIETTNGVVVDRLLAAGHPVIPVHPNVFNATRPSWGAARAKSDDPGADPVPRRSTWVALPRMIPLLSQYSNRTSRTASSGRHRGSSLGSSLK